MEILLTNDDGVYAPGLLRLAQSLREIAHVTILAPSRSWSASGHAKTLHRPLRVWEVILADQTPALTTDGAPSDCIALALLGLVPFKPDLVVSGINPTANVGQDLTYSGTVTAAMEAAIWSVPGIAVSLDAPLSLREALDFSAAAKVAQQVAVTAMAQEFPQGVVLNVNVPYQPGVEKKPYKITRQGQRVYRDELLKRLDPHGTPYYWIGGEPPSGLPEDGTDLGALEAGFVSITPLHLDLTAHQVQSEIRQWNWPNSGGAA